MAAREVGDRPMTEGLSPAFEGRTAAEAARHAALSEEARALLSDDLAPGRYLEVLTSRAFWADAVRFVASALPKREAVWWAYLCARQAHGESPPETIAATLDAVHRWVAEPDEANRRAAQAAAEQAGAGTPAGSAALAAFWSEGSLGPASLETAVPPADHLTARGVAGAVLLAAVMNEPVKAAEKFRRFLALGRDIGAGKNRWDSGSSTKPAAARAATSTGTDPNRQPSPRTARRLDTWE
jgi:Family of unknown function (DUF6931)